MKALSLFQRTCIITITTALVSVVCLGALESEEQINDTDTFASAKKPKKSTPPTVLEVKKAVGKLSKREHNAVTLYTRSFNVDTKEGIRELFVRCRDVDKKIKDNGRSIMSRQLEKLLSDRKYRKTYGVTTLKGTHFDILGPKQIVSMEKGRKVLKKTDEFLKELLEVAEATYEKSTSQLLMNQFMDWSGAKSTIYVIPNEKVWARIRQTSLKTEIVQTVVPNDETRELFMYVSPHDQDFAGQALGYSVAAQVTREYSRIITGKPDAAMPTFFITGISANAGNLEAVITEEGPQKVETFTVLGKRRKLGRPLPGKRQPPLKAKQLIPLDTLTITKGYPARTEDMFYFLLQSSVLIKDLQEKAPLSFVALTRKMAEGKKFRKEIGLSYMEMQRSIEGRELVKPQKKKNGIAPESLDVIDYKRFSKYSEKLFSELTEEHLNNMLREIQEKKKKAAAKKKTATAPAGETVSKESE